jgi:hypothetical protein
LGKNRARVVDWLARLKDELNASGTAQMFAKAEGKAATAKAGRGDRVSDTVSRNQAAAATATGAAALGNVASGVVDSAAAAAEAIGDAVDTVVVAAPAAAAALGAMAGNLADDLAAAPLRDLKATAAAAGNFTTLAAALAGCWLVPTLQGAGT